MPKKSVLPFVRRSDHLLLAQDRRPTPSANVRLHKVDVPLETPLSRPRNVKLPYHDISFVSTDVQVLPPHPRCADLVAGSHSHRIPLALWFSGSLDLASPLALMGYAVSNWLAHPRPITITSSKTGNARPLSPLQVFPCDVFFFFARPLASDDQSSPVVHCGRNDSRSNPFCHFSHTLWSFEIATVMYRLLSPMKFEI